jgi:hypothetical protein
MTVRFSTHKTSKILRGYFRGLPQTEIANAARIDQSSVSHYAGQFKETAKQIGVINAGKEYQVMEEVALLRSLSVELYNAKLTVEDAAQGYQVIRAFMKLGINPNKHLALVEICKKLDNAGFIEAALKLSSIEAKDGMGYYQVMSKLQKAQEQLPQLEKKIVDVKASLESANQSLISKKQEFVVLEEHLKKYENSVKAKEIQLQKELQAKMKQLSIEKKVVEEAAAVKIELSKKGLTMETIVALAKEYGHGNK